MKLVVSVMLESFELLAQARGVVYGTALWRGTGPCLYGDVWEGFRSALIFLVSRVFWTQLSASSVSFL
jgi:hypothetical protein